MCVSVCTNVSPVAFEPWHDQCLAESLSTGINVAPGSNVNINTQRTISPLPELGAVSQSRRPRWWLVWRRQRHRGRSFLQLELSPSGIAHGQRNPISRKTEFGTLATHNYCLLLQSKLQSSTFISFNRGFVYLLYLDDSTYLVSLVSSKLHFMCLV